jgi:hypothetical protein
MMSFQIISKGDKEQRKGLLNMIKSDSAMLIDELRAIRAEMRRLSENQMLTSRAITSLRDDLELMIRTEIGGLFAHLETRLEQRIDAAVQKGTGA